MRQKRWVAGSLINLGQNLRHANEMKMTAYKKNILAWVCITGSVLSMGLAGLYVSNWFIVPFFVVIYSAQFFLEKITCPNCVTPVTYQGTFAGFHVRGGFIRKKCQQCGWDLDKSQ